MDAKAKKLWVLHGQNPKALSRDEKLYLKAAIGEALKSAEKVLNDLKREHPFWYYEPVTGELTEPMMDFLRKHLKEEDIPQKVDGALAMHQSDAQFRVVSGGNQSSKSYSTTVDNLICATGRVPYCFDEGKPTFFKWKLPESRTKREGPQHVRVVGFDWENDVVKNLIPKYRELAPKEFLTDGSFDKSYVAGERTLYLRDGRELLGTIEFMSNKQDLTSFGGPPRRRVCFDEEPYEAVYKENLMRMATSQNFEVLLAYTPINGMSWTFDKLREKWEGGDKSIAWFQIPSVANPRANLQSLDEIMRSLDYEEKKMRLLGEYVSLSGLVYGRSFQRELHVIEPFDTSCDCGDRHISGRSDCPYEQYLCFLGIDAHMVKPSVAVLSCIDREDNYIIDRCLKGAFDTDQFKEAIAGDLLRGRRLDFSVFDPSNDSSLTVFGGRNIFHEMTHGKNRVPRARKGLKYAGSRSVGVDEVKKRLRVDERTKKPRFFIMDRPENQNLIKTMRTMQVHHIDNPALKGQPDEILEGEHDEHAANRYIMQNKLRWKPAIDAAPVSPIPDEEAMLV